MKHNSDSDMRREYDFSNGVRGKHNAQYSAGTNAVFSMPIWRVCSRIPNL